EDPIDTAIFRAAWELPGLRDRLAGFRVKEFMPFDPVSKRTEALVQTPGGEPFRVIKGAPQVVHEASEAREALGKEVTRQVEELALRGYRALGIAKERSGGKFHFLGLLALFDPPREDSAETLQRALDLGVQVKMVTGDHTAIAREVSEQVHLGGNIEEASHFLGKPDRQAERIVEGADGFAQVFPEHKYQIVELLQRAGHIVGMTRDGVNDAPALKKADAGIAVAGATDAARSAADIVLTEPGLSVITDAITESRRVFARMNSYAVYRITETVRILFFITLSILAFNFYPVTAVMIVLLALLNDGPIMAIAYDRADYGHEPVRWDMRVVLGISTFLGLVGVGSSFGLFYLARDVFQLPAAQVQSLLFLKLAVAGHLTIFLTRTRGPFWSSRPSAALLLSAVLTKLLATFVVVYGWFVAPLGWKPAAYVWLYAVAAFVITDLVKVPFYRLLDHGDARFSR
ncbi:MAG: HAD-IC family P-type ATPase, partial [Longimicrobiales bacterium]